MAEFPLYLLPFFFLIAVLYSSVGHGGASGYLAVFALFGIANPSIAPLALMLNIIVASTSWVQYYRNGFFSWRLLFPFVTASIPMAFLGGMIPISQNLFSILLGLSLLFASARLFFLGEIKSEAENFSVQKLWMFGVPLGAILGLLSGMVGIGGGVFLSPILLFMKWTNAKQTAAIASAFIVLNSFSGITGHLTRANVDFTSSLPFVGAVFAGGFLGSRFGAEKFRLKTLQYLLAIVLLSAGTKLVSKLF